MNNLLYSKWVINTLTGPNQTLRQAAKNRALFSSVWLKIQRDSDFLGQLLISLSFLIIFGKIQMKAARHC